MRLKKSLSARAQERAQRVSRAARIRAQIVALQPEIAQAVTDGCSLAMIWNTLHEEGTIAFGYETFRVHVRKLTRPHPAAHPTPSATPDRSTHRTTPTKPASPRPSDTSGFVFNPIPNEEELY